ncbi:MAG: DUF4065 domain-containing protein [Bacilli bacterium]|nr:DUF4065 domain-containing protein [Bacilli bacterium]
MKDTNCEYEEGVVKEIIDGIEVEYLEKRYICSISHEKVYDEETFNYNVLEANSKLREKTGLITINEIRELSAKYDIGVKPLALVMGLGEVTLMRYLEGKNPTRDISDKLKMALKSPEYFEINLMDNKDKITDVAFKKALGRVKQLELSHDHSKIYQVALYIISKYEDTTNMALQKILYFVNGFSNKFLGSYLFNDLAQAWIHGPVYPDIYDSLSYFKYDTINSNKLLCGYDYELSDEEKKYIDSVAPLFACYSGNCLRNMSHLTDPWIDARQGLKEDEPSERVLEKKDVEKYFEDVCTKYKIDTVKDIRNYIDDLLFNAIEKS